MSIRLMSRVFQARIPDVEITQGGLSRNVTTPTLKLLLLAWADHANDDGEGMYPSQTTLEKKTGLSHSSINAAISAAKQAGYVSYVGMSKRGTSEYKLDPSKLVPWQDYENGDSTVTVPLPVPQEDSGGASAVHDSSLNPSPDSSSELVRVLFKGDHREYPENLWGVARCMQDDWGFSLPPRPVKREKKGQYSMWILSLQDLLNACGEFGIKALKEYRKDFANHMAQHGGVAPHTVAGPQSLINSVRGKAAEMRANPARQESVIFRAADQPEMKTTPPPDYVKERLGKLTKKLEVK